MPSPFSPSDAALSFFPFAKKEPRYVLQFMGLYGVFTAVAMVFGSVTGVNADFNKIIESQAKIQGNSDAALALVANLNWPVLLLHLAVMFLIGVLMQASAIRKTIFSEEVRPLGLSIGPDESRLLLAQLAALGVFILAYVVIILGSAAVGALLGFVTDIMPTGIGRPLAGLLGIILIVFVVCLLLALAIRISLFGVVTQVEKRISIKSWIDHTKGAFWELMGAFVLWGLVAIIISIVADGILQALVGGLGQSLTVQPTTFTSSLNPILLIAAALKGAVSGFFALGSVCVGAFAWHQLQAGKSAS